MTKRRTMLDLDEADALEPADSPVDQECDMPDTADDTDQQSQMEQDASELEMADQLWEEEPLKIPSARDRFITISCLIAAIGWIGFFVWARQDTLLAATSSPSLWVSALFELLIPLLLLAILWQLMIRSSRAEQARFADTAKMLASESAALEERLTAINRELSLARDFVASQSRDLESLGRVAAERLSENATTLQGLIVHNSAQVESIGKVSENALSNMEKLRDQMPVLANSARDVTNQIGNVGNVAERQVDALAESMKQLEAYGSSGEDHVRKIIARIDEAMSAFDRNASELGNNALETFTSINRQSEDFQRQVLERDQEAIAATQNRARQLEEFLDGRNERLLEIEGRSISTIRASVSALATECDSILVAMGQRRDETTSTLTDAIVALEERLNEAIARVAKVDQDALESAQARLRSLGEEAERLDASTAESAASFAEELARRQEDAQSRESEALAALEERLARFDERLSEREKGHLSHVETLASRSEELAQRLSKVDEDIGALSGRFEETKGVIGQSAEQLSEQLAQSRQTLEENGKTLATLTEDSVRLLEILRSSGSHADETVLAAVAKAEHQLSTVKSDAEALGALIEQAEGRGASLAEHVQSARSQGSDALGLFEQLTARLGEIAEQSSAISEQTRSELQSAMDELGEKSASMLNDLREGQSEAIREVAGSIAAKSNEAIAQALSDEAGSSIAELEEAARRASDAGKETSRQLRDQLAIVNELTGNLEQRVAVAREKAEEKLDHEFTRRMALITEALNSSAIDISRAFEVDVADTQWAQYLRGDRGIFTRRAVTLLEKPEARSVHDVYEEDSQFRETVNRYIHDFEAMLRQVLSTRDGNAVAVTLLSSDIGKLYVALAQAIDRLRD